MSSLATLLQNQSTKYQYTESIKISSRFTATEAEEVEKFIRNFATFFQTIEANKTKLTSKKLVLDFGETIFIDNKGLLGLCTILRLAKDHKISLSFSSFSPQVKMVLSLAGLEAKLSLENTINYN